MITDTNLTDDNNRLVLSYWDRKVTIKCNSKAQSRKISRFHYSSFALFAAAPFLLLGALQLDRSLGAWAEILVSIVIILPFIFVLNRISAKIEQVKHFQGIPQFDKNKNLKMLFTGKSFLIVIVLIPLAAEIGDTLIFRDAMPFVSGITIGAFLLCVYNLQKLLEDLTS